jgi:hypothetical protein
MQYRQLCALLGTLVHAHHVANNPLLKRSDWHACLNYRHLFTPAYCCRCPAAAAAAAAVCAAGYLGAGKVRSTGEPTAQLMLQHAGTPSLPALGSSQ